MARKTVPLTDTQIKASKPKDKDYQLYDGDGLLLLIKASGSRMWQFRYYHPTNNKRTTLSFGSYPEISLQQARKKRDEARELIKQNIGQQDHRLELERTKQEG